MIRVPDLSGSLCHPSHPCPVCYIEALAARLAEGRFHSIPEAGHYSWIEQRGQVRALLQRFIAEIEQGNRLAHGT